MKMQSLQDSRTLDFTIRFRGLEGFYNGQEVHGDFKFALGLVRDWWPQKVDFSSFQLWPSFETRRSMFMNMFGNAASFGNRSEVPSLGLS